MPGSNIEYSTGDFLYDSQEFPTSLKSISTLQPVAAKPSIAPMKLKTDGLDFNNVKAVLQWLRNNGANIAVDNMYGKSTNAAIDLVLKNMVLTSAEKQKFIDLLNRMKGRWIGRKTIKPALKPIEKPLLIELNERLMDWTESENGPYRPYGYAPRYPSWIRGGEEYFYTLAPKLNPIYEYRKTTPSFSLELESSRFNPKFQLGGTMNNQQELQKAFMAYLIQDAQTQGIQIQSEQDLLAYAELLGEDGIKAKYQEFMLKMQGGVMARLGAKLEYFKKLKGVCPEGEELIYFKQGGRICKACQKALKGTKVTKKANEVDKFKAGRALYKKDMKSAKYAKKDACGSKMK